MSDKNGKRHGEETSTYYYSGGEEVEYDEEYDNFDIDDLDDEDVSEYSSYYWHGEDVSREEYTQKVKQHGKWLKGMESLDLSALKKLLGNSDFVTDFVGSWDLQESLLKNATITARDYSQLKSKNRELSEALSFLESVKKDEEKGIQTTFYENGRIKKRFQVRDGKKNGFYEKYSEYWGNAIEEKGTYKDDQLEGEYIEYYRDGTPHRISHYKQGKLHGPRTTPYLKCNYKDGVLDGDYHYDDRHNGAGSYRIGTYTDGKFSGVDCGNKPYDPREDGPRVVIKTLKNDILNGPYFEYYGSNGRGVGPEGYKKQADGTYALEHLALKCTYKDGKLNGLYEEYYENGQLKRKCRYMNGLLSGLCEEYNRDGSLKSKVVYKDGEIDKSPLAKDKTSKLRRGFLKVLDTVDKLPPTKGRRAIKRAVTKGYRLITPKEKNKRTDR